MAIDANHTARARRDGLPLPNPFGLNDIGERMGFGKAWPGNPNVAATAQQATRTAAEQASQAFRDAADFARQASGRTATQPPPNAGSSPDAHNPYNQSQNWANTYTGATPPPYGSVYPAEPPVVSTPLNRFPAGAVWLIGLGSIFLLATTGLFDSIHPNVVLGLILVGLGVWVFVRRMSESGLSWRSDGSAAYRYRVFRALRVSVWLVGIGFWFVLDAFRWAHLHHTWPLLLILGGVMALLERVFFNAAQADLSVTPEAAGGWAADSGTTTTPVSNTSKGGN